MSLRDYLFHEEPGITLYCGDCREILPLLGRVDAVLADPPYGVLLNGKRANHRGGVSTREGAYTHGDDSPEYVRTAVVPAIEECRLFSPTVVVTPGTRCMWLYREPDDVGCWFSAGGTGLGRWGFTCMQPILYYGLDPYLANGLGARPNSVGQKWPNDANDYGHPCAKPMKFWSWMVARVSLEGETVLDPFVGSGTTLEAAKNLRRKAIGIEIEPKYCEIAVKRLRQEVLL